MTSTSGANALSANQGKVLNDALTTETNRATTAEGTKIAKADAFAGDVTGTYDATVIGNNAVTSAKISDDAVTASKIAADVAGTGLKQNATTGALEVDAATVTGDGTITSTDLTVTGGDECGLQRCNTRY